MEVQEDYNDTSYSSTTTQRLTTTLGEDEGGGEGNNATTTGASAGFAGAIMFVIVIIIIVILSKRLRHQRKRSGHGKHGDLDPEAADAGSRASDDESSDSDDEAHEMHAFQHDKLSRHVSVMSTDSFRLPMWQEVDDDIKAAVSSSLIDTKTLTLGNVLGKGQFGMVYQASLCKTGRNSNDYGKISHEKVAVKTLKGSNIDKETIEAFLREGMIMKEFKHKNVLGLLGVALGDHGIPMIVLPFMANGNLKKYIGKAHLLITVRELLVFGKEVAEGMKYLADNKFVHRDLAARNCMLDDMFSVKVADFGLSRDMHEKEYYSSTDTKAKLPVKWMALESIANSVYTSKSDVWSYGVVLWELLTRGATPYPDVANWDVFSYIRSGRRMPQPHLCPDVVYVLMKECWIPNPLERPDFGEIITRLEEIIEPPTRQSSVATEDDDDYYNLYVNVEVDDYVQPD